MDLALPFLLCSKPRFSFINTSCHKYFSSRGTMESEQQTGKGAQRRKSRSASQSEKDKRTTSGDAPKNRKCFEIDIFRDWCKSCGICAAFCPRECIRLDEEGAPTCIDSSRCTGCGWCEIHCPDFAISVHERDHLKGDSA